MERDWLLLRSVPAFRLARPRLYHPDQLCFPLCHSPYE